MARKKDAAPALQLPVLIFGVVEIRRLKRELEALEDYVKQASIREPGKQPPLPRVSRLLEALATENKLQLLELDHRKQLKAFLEYTETKAPNLHISFAADPSSAFTAKIVTWLRANIHPHTLLEVGLQPTIAAGCIVRTTNKVFDFSLRESFKDAGALLSKALQAAGAGGVTPALVGAGASVAAAMPAAATAPAVAPVQPEVAAPAATATVPAPIAGPIQPLEPTAAEPATVIPATETVAPAPVVNVEDVAAQLAVTTADEAAAVQQSVHDSEAKV